MRTLVFLALVAVAAPAGAIYQCKGASGAAVFQDTPCEGGGGRQLQVQPAAGASPAPSGNGAGLGSDAQGRLARLRQQADDAARDRRVRDIGYEIRDAELAIDRLEAEMLREISALKSRKRFANNNLAGATWEASLSQEMDATARKFEVRMENERAKITRLEQERERLAAPR